MLCQAGNLFLLTKGRKHIFNNRIISRRGIIGFENEQKMFNIMRKKLYTAVCCDVMDDLGFRRQALNCNIRPISKNNIVMGRAKTILSTETHEIYDNPYEGEIKAVDSIKKNEVVVIKTGKSEYSGVWGELLSMAAMVRGANGAIIDGYSRDIKKIKEINFPVFTAGFSPLDSKGRSKIIDFDCPIICGGVEINPGDIIFGDYDGVISIPKSIAEKVIVMAQNKVEKENMIKEGIYNGKYLDELYNEYGIL